MSAAHLYQHNKYQMRHSLEHWTQAISSLASQISALGLADGEAKGVSLQKRGNSGSDTSANTAAMLLSAVNLGMTSTWHEALVSWHTDQNLAALDYLWPFCGFPETATREKHTPSPLPGVCSELLIYMAYVGTISRQLELVNRLHRLSIPGTCESEGDLMYHSLLKKAREIANSVRAYTPLPIDRMQETGDELTPLSHFYIMSQVFQLTILLELYRIFPDINEHQSESSDSDHVHSLPDNKYYNRHFCVSLAINIRLPQAHYKTTQIPLG
ncbi:hypothetical protein BDW74DRAFT_175616 [Aspergillus multicolor]|uniref:uncharacterized protein n=1 Tax=Aspergillus multicolor TaxID=41759 RepID=UPI003CCD94D1